MKSFFGIVSKTIELITTTQNKTDTELADFLGLPEIQGTKKISAGITFIIPHKNNPDFLELCVKSINKNTVGAFEIIIADDYSEKKEFDRIKKLAAENTMVLRCSRKPSIFTPHRHACVLEYLYRIVRTEFAVCLDQDSIILSKNWQSLLKEFKKPELLLLGVRDNCAIRHSQQMLHPSFIILNKQRCEKALQRPLFFGARPNYTSFKIGQDEPYHALSCKALAQSKKTIEYLDSFQTKYGFGIVGYFKRKQKKIFYHQWYSGRIYKLKDKTIDARPVSKIKKSIKDFLQDYKKGKANFSEKNQKQLSSIY